MSCGHKVTNIELYLAELGVEGGDYRNILIIPLGGCESGIVSHIRPLDNYYPCGELEGSLIILCADYEKQLFQLTNLNLPLPSCIIFDTETKAYYSGLVGHYPVLYSRGVWGSFFMLNANDEQYSSILNEKFYLNFLHKDTLVGLSK